MKILLITLDFPPNPGGISIFLQNLCEQLSNFGHKVDVLTSVRDNSVSTGNRRPYDIFRYSSFKFMSSLAPLYKTISLHNKNNYDIIFLGHFITTHALGALFLRKFMNVPYIILSHGNDISGFTKTLIDKLTTRFILSGASLVISNSRFTAHRVNAGGYKGVHEVINPGVDVKLFKPGIDTESVRRQYRLYGRRVILTTARLVAKKNIDSVLRALPDVIKCVPDVLYIVAGDGQERKRLEGLSMELGITDNVKFLGEVENNMLPALYCSSELYVMPSKEIISGGDIETFGISFLEASACGLPVIGSHSGGIYDSVIDNETGLLVNPSDASAIASAIIKLLTDNNLARQFGKNGRQRAEREFSWEIIGKRFESVFARYM